MKIVYIFYFHNNYLWVNYENERIKSFDKLILKKIKIYIGHLYYIMIKKMNSVIF